MGPWFNEISAFIRLDTRELAVPFCLLCGHSQKVAICKPERELSPEPDRAGTLIAGLQPPEL